MDQLFSRFFGPEEEIWRGDLSVPSLDLSETENEIEVRLDLPGMKPEEIDLRIDGDVLTVSGEHTEERKEQEGRKYHRIERRTGSFLRRVPLPCAVREDQVDATFRDGVLTITMPKCEEAKSHKIPIKGNSGT